MNHRFLKYSLLVLSLLCFSLTTSAQRRCIVMFDCTESMLPTDNDCWDDAQKALEDIVNNMCDNSTEIIIIPFQDANHHLSILETDKIELLNSNKLEDIYNNIEKKHSGTCMINALLTASKYISSSYLNTVCLITDGKEEDCFGTKSHSQEELLDIIKQWCGKYGDNVQNFYVPLSKQAMAPDFIKVLEKSCFRPVKPGTVFGNFHEQDIKLNTEEIVANKYKKINFTRNDKFKVSVITDDPYFDVSLIDDSVENGSAQLQVKIKNGLTPEELRARLASSISNDEYYFNARFVSNSVDFGNKDNIGISVVFKLQKILSLPDDERIDFGKSHYYPSFWFWKSKGPDELVYSLKPTFNDEAKRKNAQVRLRLVCEEDIDKTKFKFYCNNEERTNCEFTISANDKTPYNLKIVFSPETPSGKKRFHLEVVPNSNTFDKITGYREFDSPDQCRIPVVAKFSSDSNPLKLGLFLLLILFLICCVIRILYSHSRKGIYSGIDYFVDGNREILIRRRKCNRIILSQRPKRQSVLNWLFNGKTLYNSEPLPCLTSDILLNAAGRKRIIMRARFHPNREYLFDGMQMRKQIITSDEDITHTISDINNNIILTFKFY